jgi:hypothetical protein
MKNTDPKWLPWLSAPVLAVDIETTTRPKPNYPSQIKKIKELGLSAVSPITDVAIYADGLGIAYFDMQGFDPYLETLTDEAIDNWNIIHSLLCRNDVTIVGHNALFDLRSLGVQYNAYRHLLSKKLGKPTHRGRYFWKIPHGARVWCTEMIAKRMLLGEQVSKKTGIGERFDILSLANRLMVEIPKETLDMVSWMKTQRSSLSDLSKTLSQLSRDAEIWSYLGGWIPPNFETEIQEASFKLIADYVGFDAKVAYEIYQMGRFN